MEVQGRICPRGAGYYTWQEGDTVASVIQANGTTQQALQLINPGVDFSEILPGTEICMPSQPYTCISGMAYSVRAGDTFYAIAEMFGISTLELQERNPGVDPDRLTVGQVLCVPMMTSGGSNNNDDLNVLPDDDPYLPTPSLPSTPSTPPTVVYPNTSVCPSGYTRDIVQAGQTYADLLTRHNVSYRAMRSANPRLSPSYMVVGTAYCAPPSGTRQTCTGLTTYTILPGEDIDTLARDLRTTRGRLLALNPTLLPSDFSSGTVICIP